MPINYFIDHSSQRHYRGWESSLPEYTGKGNGSVGTYRFSLQCWLVLSAYSCVREAVFEQVPRSCVRKPDSREFSNKWKYYMTSLKAQWYWLCQARKNFWVTLRGCWPSSIIVKSIPEPDEQACITTELPTSLSLEERVEISFLVTFNPPVTVTSWAPREWSCWSVHSESLRSLGKVLLNLNCQNFQKFQRDKVWINTVYEKRHWYMCLNFKPHNFVIVNFRFSYEISQRYPFLYGPTILTMSACYDTAVWSCCQEENKTECLQTKVMHTQFSCHLGLCYGNCGLWTSSITSPHSVLEMHTFLQAW